MIIELMHLLLGLITGIAVIGAVLTRNNYIYVRGSGDKKEIILATVINILGVLVAIGVVAFVMKIVRRASPVEWINLGLLVFSFLVTFIVCWNFFIKPKKQPDNPM